MLVSCFCLHTLTLQVRGWVEEPRKALTDAPKVAGSLMDTDDHITIHSGLGSCKELAAVLGAEEAVRCSLAIFEGK